jgi:hypothetical protein
MSSQYSSEAVRRRSTDVARFRGTVRACATARGALLVCAAVEGRSAPGTRGPITQRHRDAEAGVTQEVSHECGRYQALRTNRRKRTGRAVQGLLVQSPSGATRSREHRGNLLTVDSQDEVPGRWLLRRRRRLGRESGCRPGLASPHVVT